MFAYAIIIITSSSSSGIGNGNDSTGSFMLLGHFHHKIIQNKTSFTY